MKQTQHARRRFLMGSVLACFSRLMSLGTTRTLQNKIRKKVDQFISPKQRLLQKKGSTTRIHKKDEMRKKSGAGGGGTAHPLFTLPSSRTSVLIRAPYPLSPPALQSSCVTLSSKRNARRAKRNDNSRVYSALDSWSSHVQLINIYSVIAGSWVSPMVSWLVSASPTSARFVNM